MKNKMFTKGYVASNIAACRWPILLLSLMCVYVGLTMLKYEYEVRNYVKVSGYPKPLPFKTILWYNPPYYVTSRISDKLDLFRKCDFKNCHVVKDKRQAETSDAVIFALFNARNLKRFKRPRDQIWIIWQHESPSWEKPSNPSVFPESDGFNWTLSFRPGSDIYLPYGQMVRKEFSSKRNYTEIALNKTNDALWIVSHCPTRSKREAFVKLLRRHISVDILGRCGTKWDCGKRLKHDDCFEIMNTTYRFYLAFENALCDNYITEKFFENYKYDILFVQRGGGRNPSWFPRDSSINTRDFKSVRELGHYLAGLKKDTAEYANQLQQKDTYYSVDYGGLYSRAFCELCAILNNVEKYRFTYPNIRAWHNNASGCQNPKDLSPK